MLPLYLMIVGSTAIMLGFTLPTILRRRLDRFRKDFREADADFARGAKGVWVFVPGFPQVYGWGRTKNRAWKNLLEAAHLHRVISHHV